MGQKIHPNGLRLGIVNKHLSYWYENKTNYSTTIKEDFFIRKILSNLLKKKNIKLSLININRYAKNKKILVHIEIKDIDKVLTLELEQMEQKITKKLKTNKTIKIIPKIIEEEYKNVELVGQKIVDDLCKRVPFKRAIKDTMNKCQQAGILGIKIQVSGRLNGVEIARSEWRREGRVPLHTLKALINYSQQEAQTIYGIIGVKVWLYNGENLFISKKFV